MGRNQGGQRYNFLVEKNLYYLAPLVDHPFIRIAFEIVTYKCLFPLNFTPESPHITNPDYMDNKVTLSFDQEVIRRAKEYAAGQHISLSRLVEFLLHRATTGEYRSLEDYPIADWVREVAEGPAKYNTSSKSRKVLKDEFFTSRKKK